MAVRSIEPGHPDPRELIELDTSVRTLIVAQLRALVGLLVAFSVAWEGTELAGLHHGALGFVAMAMVFAITASAALFVTSARPLRNALKLQRQAILDQEESLRSVARGHQFTADLNEALEMVTSEEEMLPVVTRAMELVTDAPAELLLADSSRAHLKQVVATNRGEVPGCQVATPRGCPAVRRGQALVYADSRELAVCPHLRERAEDVSATCVPVTILGRPMGVMQVVGPDGSPLDPSQRAQLETVATQVGARIGVIRSMLASELAATTDPLTGQLNRRSLEEEMRHLVREDRPFAVAFADLDHFKALNDTYGHATGDRALRHFATVTAGAMRRGDLVCRWGGEEFVLLFSDCDVTEAAPVAHRLRAALAESVGTVGLPSFTVSLGLADSSYASDAADVIALADSALLTAKREGRDRLIIAARPESPRGDAPPRRRLDPTRSAPLPLGAPAPT